jgi:hypothetical protein
MLHCALARHRKEVEGDYRLGFIGYRRQRNGNSEEVVRIYLECREDRPGEIACGNSVDVVFPGGQEPCQLRGVDGVLVLKKFYKLVFSLEERAREHGNDWRSVMQSPERLLEHLRYTRNARDFTGSAEPSRSLTGEEMDDPDCMKIGEGT